jgi:hypothetical protein
MDDDGILEGLKPNGNPNWDSFLRFALSENDYYDVTGTDE